MEEEEEEEGLVPGARVEGGDGSAYFFCVCEESICFSCMQGFCRTSDMRLRFDLKITARLFIIQKSSIGRQVDVWRCLELISSGLALVP